MCICALCIHMHVFRGLCSHRLAMHQQLFSCWSLCSVGNKPVYRLSKQPNWQSQHWKKLNLWRCSCVIQSYTEGCLLIRQEISVVAVPLRWALAGSLLPWGSCCQAHLAATSARSCHVSLAYAATHLHPHEHFQDVTSSPSSQFMYSKSMLRKVMWVKTLILPFPNN